MKYVLRALPIIVFPFTVNFPGAILVYWASSNFVSLAQVGFLKLPKVREYFKIEKQIKFDPTTLPIKPKGFREGLTDCKIFFKFFLSTIIKGEAWLTYKIASCSYSCTNLMIFYLLKLFLSGQGFHEELFPKNCMEKKKEDFHL